MEPLYGDSKSTIERRRKLAEALMYSATDSSPVGHWMGAAARGVQGLASGYIGAQADKSDKARRKSLVEALMGKSPDEIEALALESGDDELYDIAARRRKSADSITENKHGNSLYTIKGPNGELRYVQPFSGGGVNEVPLPEGFQPTETINYLNQGTQFGGMGAKSGQPGPTIPIDIEGQEQAKKVGAGMGQRTIDAPQAQFALQNSISQLSAMGDQAAQVRNSPGLERSTGAWSYIPNMPGGEAADTQADLNTLKVKIGFNALQAMRDASKTGGALGQIAIQEGIWLQNSLESLEQSQSKEQFEQQLDDIIGWTEGAKQRLQQAYDQTYGSGQSEGDGDPLAEARAAIQRGADPEMVKNRLMENGIDPSGLGQ